jgi:large repetitive protein
MKHHRLLAAVLAVALLLSTPLSVQAQSSPPNNPPTASFRYSYFITTYTFDARASRDWDGSIVEYSWDFGDGNAVATTSPIVQHSYMDAGEFYVFLTVTDNQGGHSTTWRLVKTCGGPSQPVCPI